MSQFFPSSAAGANQNLDNTFEPVLWGTDGAGTTLTSGAGANTRSATSASLVTTANAWAGFFLYLWGASGSANRYLIDLSFDGGTTWALIDYYVEPSNGGFQAGVKIPVKCAASSDIRYRSRSSATSGTLKIGIVGIIRNSQSAPCFTNMVALNSDQTNTRASATFTPITRTADAAAWTLQLASTAVDYGGLYVGLGAGAAAPATSQNSVALVGLGASTAEVECYRQPVQIGATTTPIQHAMGLVIEKAIPAASRITTKVLAPTSTGADITAGISVGVYGLAA